MDISIVINTCFEYKDKTLEPLLKTLQDAQVPKDCIHIVVGQCQNDEDYEVDGIKYHNRRWYNVDNNAMLWLTQERVLKTKWVVYLHDTSKVADYFWSSCQDVVSRCQDYDGIKLYMDFSMGMGFYQTEYLYREDVVSFMGNLMNYDKAKLLEIKNNLDMMEDTLFKYGMRNNYKIVSLANQYRVINKDFKMYGTETPRIVEFYEIPGIYKIKANYGQSSQLFVGV